jgi:hypothetical protein
MLLGALYVVYSSFSQCPARQKKAHPMPILTSTIIGLAAAFAAPEGSPSAAPAPWLDWFAARLSFATAEAEPADEDPGVLEVPAMGNTPTEIARMRREMQALRTEVIQLQATLTQFMDEVAGPLHAENTHLREELQRIYMLQGDDPTGLFPQVPRPNDDLVQDIVDTAVARVMAEQNVRRGASASFLPPQTAGFPDTPGAVPAPGGETAAVGEQPAGEPGYEIISEWGRESDSPLVLSGEATSLKGMVVVVPPGMRRTELVRLGRELRAKYDDYANINIEVFDQVLAAQSFAETSVSTGPEHRVLSISRHLASGRDTIVYLDDGIATEVDDNKKEGQ